MDGDDTEETSKQEVDEATRVDDIINDTKSISMPDVSFIGFQNMDVECENEFPNLSQVESRASVPPLEVTLDDIDQSDVGNIVGENQEQIDVADTLDENRKRRAKKKAKEERYYLAIC